MVSGGNFKRRLNLTKVRFLSIELNKGMKSYFYLYQITNCINGKVYVGVHKTNNLDDGYMGSGKRLCYAIEKYGIENFRKEILEYFDSMEDMFSREAEIVNEEFALNENTYNIAVGGRGGSTKATNGKTGKKVSKEGVERIRASRLKYEKQMTEKDKETRRERVRLGLQLAIKNGYNPATFLGRTHSTETKSKISEKAKIHQKGERNSQFGKMWITNGIKNQKIHKDNTIPKGWKKGRVMKPKTT